MVFQIGQKFYKFVNFRDCKILELLIFQFGKFRKFSKFCNSENPQIDEQFQNFLIFGVKFCGFPNWAKTQFEFFFSFSFEYFKYSKFLNFRTHEFFFLTIRSIDVIKISNSLHYKFIYDFSKKHFLISFANLKINKIFLRFFCKSMQAFFIAQKRNADLFFRKMINK